MRTLIAALSKNRVIGQQGDIPWELSDDLRRFKRLTVGKTVVMGRKTYESIGRLEDRKNIVLTRDSSFVAPGCEVVTRSYQVLAEASSQSEESEIMIIGGAEIYESFLPFVGTMHLTLIGADFAGDAFFPDDLGDNWLVGPIHHAAQPDVPFPWRYVTLTRTLKTHSCRKCPRLPVVTTTTELIKYFWP